MITKIATTTRSPRLYAPNWLQMLANIAHKKQLQNIVTPPKKKTTTTGYNRQKLHQNNLLQNDYT
jgi:hypothetical protein